MRHLKLLQAFVAAARLVFQPYLETARRRRTGRAKGKGKATGGQGAKLRAAKRAARVVPPKDSRASLAPARNEMLKRRPHDPPPKPS